MGTKISDVAEAFVEGKAAKAGNAHTDGTTYWLHGSDIARKTAHGVRFEWHGWYTPTTANHLNRIAEALGLPNRFSYSRFRDYGADQGYFHEVQLSTCSQQVFQAHYELHRA